MKERNKILSEIKLLFEGDNCSKYKNIKELIKL